MNVIPVGHQRLSSITSILINYNSQRLHISQSNRKGKYEQMLKFQKRTKPLVRYNIVYTIQDISRIFL